MRTSPMKNAMNASKCLGNSFRSDELECNEPGDGGGVTHAPLGEVVCCGGEGSDIYPGRVRPRSVRSSRTAQSTWLCQSLRVKKIDDKVI